MIIIITSASQLVIESVIWICTRGDDTIQYYFTALFTFAVIFGTPVVTFIFTYVVNDENLDKHIS